MMRLQATTMTVLFTAALALGATTARAGTITLTGTVGDTMCGLTHMVRGDDAACTRACVKGGADYALIIATRVYTLKGNEKIKSQLDKFAGQRVAVTGTQTGNAVEVTSVSLLAHK
jgi:type 1 fimbria pilin